MNTFPSTPSTGNVPVRATLVALVALGATLSAPAHAYVGPGAGLGVIGTLFGIGAAIVLAMFGLLWYPLKRAFGKKGVADGAAASGTPGDAMTHETHETPATRTGPPATDAERDDTSISNK